MSISSAKLSGSQTVDDEEARFLPHEFVRISLRELPEESVLYRKMT
jgi:hypothetical protein